MLLVMRRYAQIQFSYKCGCSCADMVNGHTSNGHQENGDSKSPKVEKVGENGDSPIPSKRTTCRYMVPTESAKAKFRSSSNPKTRAPDTPESPVRTTPKRYSIGSSPTVSKGTDSPKTAFGTRKTHSFQVRYLTRLFNTQDTICVTLKHYNICRSVTFGR